VEHLFCSNNEGLVLRVGKAMDRSWANPNHCLASECNVKSGIVELLHAMPVNFSIQHVLGHQDAKVSVENLPWEAQMNCRANACASNCLVDSSEPSKIVPFVPASKASISIVVPVCILHFASGVALPRELSHFERPRCDSACNATGMG
jgi:hypothetical protein